MISASASPTRTKPDPAPAINPLRLGRNPWETPLIEIKERAEETQALVHLHQLTPKPICLNIYWRNSPSTLSYAFSKSNLTLINYKHSIKILPPMDKGCSHLQYNTRQDALDSTNKDCSSNFVDALDQADGTKIPNTFCSCFLGKESNKRVLQGSNS